MYKINVRYQYWGPEGITWTSWFNYMMGKTYSNRIEAENEIKELTKEEKRTKLKHEYNLEEIN